MTEPTQHSLTLVERDGYEYRFRWLCTCGVVGQWHNRNEKHSQVLWTQHVRRITGARPT